VGHIGLYRIGMAEKNRPSPILKVEIEGQGYRLSVNASHLEAMRASIAVVAIIAVAVVAVVLVVAMTWP
jgi:hypothetical protein